LQHTFVDLGVSPLANSYLTSEQRGQMEPFFPLHTHVCENCFLVQLEEFESPSQIFGDYAYFSSYSDIWLEHSKSYAEHVINRFGLDAESKVVEIGSNDGYLLQYFADNNLPVLGIEPASNVAKVAIERGIDTRIEFFGQETASDMIRQGISADLLIANNVLAHVPNLNDFVKGMKTLLSRQGVITVEFPHLLRLMSQNQFDTIYHEHFSYFSFITADKVFSTHGLKIFDVDELPTHGGSLRLYIVHAENTTTPVSQRIAELIKKEEAAGFRHLDSYLTFDSRVIETKRKLLGFLIKAKEEGKTIVAYGAPAKGNTLLNYCGIRTDFIDYAVDRSPHKQGRFLPGSRIPIHAPDRIKETEPDMVLILPWNLKDEIMKQMDYIRAWGGVFVVPIPEVSVC
jgi:2-polyprenyl-3-methyl-5-hydroxy-6-metoxy-1,4-benzoquinol methylase